MTPIILATWEAKIRRKRSGIPRFEASPGKQFLRTYLENNQPKKGLAE
jgi:hypothetical protein